MLKAYKYRIYPNKEQAEKINRTFGVCRFLYNLALETRITAWKSAEIVLSAYDLQKQVTELKKDYDWMREIDSQAINDVLNNMDLAYRSFFKQGGFPKFKKRAGRQSYGIPHPMRSAVNFKEGVISVPKIPRIKTRFSRIFEGEVRTMTVSKTPAGKYFVSILVKNADVPPLKRAVNAGTTVGIDVGIKSFLVISTGRFYEPNRYLKNSLQRLKCLQRRASRKEKGSSNRKKANLYVAKLHEKINNQRADYIHKITTGLIRDNQAETFVIEDLAVANMLKNHNLAQAISDVSFGEFFRQMTYKCEWHGKNLIKIGRFKPSSKTCSTCGTIKEDLTLADREWTCGRCGTAHDRDLNAAKNIKAFGLKQYSRQEMSGEPAEPRRIRRAKKQETNFEEVKEGDGEMWHPQDYSGKNATQPIPSSNSPEQDAPLNPENK
jgi:putative transposase